MADTLGEPKSNTSPGEDTGSDETELRAGAPPPQSNATPQLSPNDVKAIRDALVDVDPDERRYSLWGLLGIITGASLVLAVGSYFPKSVFAGAVGIATLVTLVALSAMKNPPAVLQIAWWTLLLIYLMAIGSAILG